MDKRVLYVTPALRYVALSLDENFLTSGSGENADPKDGNWTSPFYGFDDEF